MSNWILCLTKNNLNLTRNAVRTFLAQDIGDIKILIIDDHSTDGTLHWAQSVPVMVIPRFGHSGVAAAWNLGLEIIFKSNDHALVVNNDVELRPDTYRWLVREGGGFVTAVGSNDRTKIQQPMEAVDVSDAQYSGPMPPPDEVYVPQPFPAPTAEPRPHPDFSCYLIRKELYEEVGPFDENYKGAYAEDGDYHLRMHQAGVEAICLDLPFYHIGAGTLKNASPEDQERIQKQAGRNRAYLKQKFGVGIGSPEYYALFGHGSPEESLNELESDRGDKSIQD